MARRKTSSKKNSKQRTVFAAGVALLPAFAAHAQTAPKADVIVPPKPEARDLNSNLYGGKSAPIAGALLRHFDVFSGNDKTGPYVLSWSRLRVSRDDRLTVIVDGQTLASNAYTVDTLKGELTFRQPVKAASLVRVSYSYDPKVSQRNTGVASAPVTVPLLQIGGLAGQGLRVTALPNTQTKDAKDPKTPLVWSLGGKSALLGGGIESLLNYAGPSGAAMKLGYKYGTDKTGFFADFGRTERAFAERVGSRIGLADPSQKLTLGARLAPSKWFSGGYTSANVRDLTGKSDKDTDTLNLKLGGTGQIPTLSFTRIADVTENAAKKETSVDTDRLEMNAVLGKSVSLAATGQQVNTDAPAEASDTKAEDVSVALTALNKDKTQQALVTVSSASRETTAKLEDKQNVAVKLQPAPALVISAEQKEQTVTPVVDGKEQPETNTTTQTATAEILPLPQVKISGAVIQTVTQMPVAPTEGEESTEGTTTPSTKSVTVSSTDLSARVGEGKAVEVAAGVTNRSTETPGETALNTTRAQLSLRPSNSLLITGGYVWNPEERGKVRQAMRQEFGLKAKLGSFEIGSGYALTTVNGMADVSEGAEPRFGEVSLTFGLRFDAQTFLTGTYKDALRYRDADDLPADIVPLYARAYNIDFKHDLGDDLLVSLGGSYMENRALTKDAKDVKAEARVGVRF